MKENLPIKWSSVILFLYLSLCFEIASAQDLSARVTVNTANKNMGQVLSDVQKQTKIKFVYNPEEISKAKVISRNYQNVSLLTILAELGYSAQKSGGNVIISKVESEPLSKTVNEITVKGTVRDKQGTLPGVSITVKSNSAIGVSTDVNGRFSIKVPANGVLIFSMVGYLKKEVPIQGENIMNVEMDFTDSQLDEVAIVAFGTQKKSTMVGSVTTINPKELKGPTSNLTTMLAGRIAGVIAYQRSGEPGRDNADFFIRGVTTFGTGKKDPLILINGIEVSTSDLARIQPDDIAGFSILKDATASSLYGARGANGVVLVTTKSGTEGKTKFNVRFENSLSSNTQNFQLADNITYMKLANEASATRDPLKGTPYPREKIDQTMAGDNPLLYPDNNWIDLMIKDFTNNQRLNFNLNGGGAKAQYYIAGTVNQDNGVLKTVATNNFNSNVKATNYEMRSNVNVKLTPTTEAIIRTTGQFDAYNGPVGGGSNIFSQALWSNPVKFPAYYSQDYSPYAKHTLFGNAHRENGSLYTNPFANAVSGFEQQENSNVTVQFELKQDFDFFIPGLKTRLMAYTRRNSFFSLSRQYNPFFYGANIDPQEGYMGLQLLNEGSGTEYLTYSPKDKILNTFNYIEAAATYNKVIGKKHDLSAMLIGLASNYLTGNATTLQNSLPHRNQGVSGRFTYGYDARYLTEFNFGYNGSERFDERNRYGFFPSVGLAWNIVNEPFFEKLANTITKLKLRGTFGLVGNDQIGNENDRFFYLSNVNMNFSGKGYSFGENYTEYNPGVNVTRYENREITWEKAYKTNLGLEIGINNAFNVEVDVFHEKRENILMSRAFIPSTMGLNAPIQANVGEAEGKGFEVALDYSKSFSNSSWFSFRGNFTYAKSNLLVNEEPDYAESDKLLSKIGYPVNQVFGLIAERYFVDEFEVANSPRQNFGNYMAGDIKYRDVNGDGQITNLDYVPIGYPTAPEIVFGFGFSYGYKAFDISAFFQGSARSSFWINPSNIAPFVQNPGNLVQNEGNQNGLLTHVANSHWSEDNRDTYAFWPRLSDQLVTNNTQSSTWWMRDGSFMRLKSVELGFNFPKSILNKVKFSNIRLYANALNLFSISKFKMWDAEMAGNGLGYPIQRVVNVGINVGF